mmetsp:Transcript_2460/g.5066  ORF Transcript_2460/g.5066 Transcript_2460/m.5066 type:complete len:234 (-) Transcript_2460:272-973(-)|eukprot:CAMPEP_0118939954 /NCGR_PEP_ID=MMETSP1169-20130426/30272_1 /TAXON_ID=36882 /ORGANISM="Pyramimonas obovata, Strain CCMP722" /LENGTH=233 /DNA_ID=CAMNT_0006884341 /DNA_START=144 /DNA_END=845 /DNA_ORIENTATION=+
MDPLDDTEPTEPLDSTPGGSSQYDRRYDSDVTLLRKALSNEKMAPEILDFKTELLERLQVAVQVEEKVLTERQPRPEDTLATDLHWTSLNRAKYLMRAYLRTRIWKIENNVMHILMPEHGLFERLSDHERDYATRYTGALDEHLQATVLSKMPERFQSLVQQMSPEDDSDVSARDFDMVPPPNLDTYVFCRPVEDIGNFEVDGEEFELTAMKLYMMRYRSIQPLVQSGQMDLL